MKREITLNILFLFIYEFVYAISGIIIPKLLLNSFGSEANGLVASLTSFLSVFVLLEGGMNAVIGAKLYKPLVENDHIGFNKVFVTGRLFYKKLSLYYGAFAIAIAVIYPLITRTSFSFFYVFALALILASVTFVSYNTYAIYSTVAYADNKSYVIYISYTIAAILNILLLLVGINVFPSMHFIKILTLISYLINPFILHKYVKRHYKLDLAITPDSSVLDQRWDGFAQNLSTFIMNNIDIYVLTLFSSLINVSIYSVYSAIIVSIRLIVNHTSNVLTPFLGKAKAKNLNASEIFYIQLFITGIITVVIFSCTYILLDPFIRIYTVNITDANYINPTFSFLFITSELIACLTYPYINVSFASGDFRNTKYLSYTETTVNILLSILLVFKLGLIGVIVATLISRLLRITMQINYLKKHDNDINITKSIIKSLEIIIMIVIITFILENIITFYTYTYMSWISKGFLSFIIASITCILFSLIFDKKLTTGILKDIINVVKTH